MLSVDFHQVIIDPALITNSTPMLGLYAAVQQINCIRNLDGEIVQVRKYSVFASQLLSLLFCSVWSFGSRSKDYKPYRSLSEAALVRRDGACQRMRTEFVRG